MSPIIKIVGREVSILPIFPRAMKQLPWIPCQYDISRLYRKRLKRRALKDSQHFASPIFQKGGTIQGGNRRGNAIERSPQ
ncbi:MAG: hypothetical protein ACRD1X_02000 [Vicinamibacteria bacterium]